MIRPLGFLLLALLCAVAAPAQNQNKNIHLSLGSRESGICFGSCMRYNGFRITPEDFDTEQVNGINLTGINAVKRCNGIALGLLLNMNNEVNGIALSSINMSEKVNGVCVRLSFYCHGNAERYRRSACQPL